MSTPVDNAGASSGDGVPTVFLSSTFEDLQKHRAAAIEALKALRMFVDCMENWPADARKPLAACLDRVEQCDLFVGIYAHRYGYIPSSGEVSITEQEYDHARKCGKPCCCFVVDENHPWTPAHIDIDDRNRAKLGALRARIQKEVVWKTFTTPEALRAEVSEAAASWLTDWRGKRRAKSGGVNLVPKPPCPYFPHPQPVPENFTGRVSERAALTEWLKSDLTHPLLLLFGLGGLGKSAMCWQWATGDAVSSQASIDGLFWWDFRENEAKFASFLERLLLYVSGSSIDPRALASDHDRIEALGLYLRERRFLVVLDGVEKLLEGRQTRDEGVGRESAETVSRPSRDLANCAEPSVSALFRRFADRATRSKTLVITQIPPRELEDMVGCAKMELKGWVPEEAVTFMRNQGVRGSKADILRECLRYECHPLCLRLLAGMIRRDPEHPGRIEAGNNIDPIAAADGRQTRMVELAFSTLDKEAQDLLTRMAAFRGRLRYSDARLVSPYPNEPELKQALGDLVSTGLLSWAEEECWYTFHPVVQRYAYGRLRDKSEVHRLLGDYFLHRPQPGTVSTLEDLAIPIGTYYHTAKAGDFRQAIGLFRDHLAVPLFYHLAAYDVFVELLGLMFPRGVHALPALNDETLQGWAVNNLALGYSALGEKRKALGFFEKARMLFGRSTDQRHLVSVLGNMARVQVQTGALSAAAATIRETIEKDVEIGDSNDEAVARLQMARLYGYLGDEEGIESELKKAFAIVVGGSDRRLLCLTWIYCATIALLDDKPEVALQAVSRAMQVGASADHTMDALDLLRLSLVAGAAKIRLGRLDEAEKDLDEASQRCGRVRAAEYETDILLEFAKLKRVRAGQSGEAGRRLLRDQATEDAREALQIAERHDLRLRRSDIHLFLAEMAMESGDMSSAAKEAQTARSHAQCDGAPYCYRKVVTAAEDLLRKAEQKKAGS